jgi:hypothetical protein
MILYICIAFLVGIVIGTIIGIAYYNKENNDLLAENTNFKVAMSTSTWARQRSNELYDTGLMYVKSQDPDDITRGVTCMSQANHLMNESGKMIEKGLDGTLLERVKQLQEDTNERHKHS